MIEPGGVLVDRWDLAAWADVRIERVAVAGLAALGRAVAALQKKR